MKRRFPVGTIFKVKEYTVIDFRKRFNGYRYYKILRHYPYCVHMTEVMKKETKNGVGWVEKGRHTNNSPSYVDLYFLLKNGVKVKE
ncbi:hypothetical protein [Anaerosporobacter mobilis]|nr:hypothetical protein [Anaerosporobacter mobilis]